MLFRYLAARWKHPRAADQRYIRAGLALETRAGLLSTFWSDHLSRTRAAQARWSSSFDADVLTVLGAGTLLDLNTPALAPHFQTFRLVDANPLVVSNWSRINKPVEPVVTDVTNCLEKWSNQVQSFRGAWDATMNLLQDLAKQPIAAYAPPSDALLSLNILSQLDVGWQEAIEPILKQRFGRSFVQQHEQDWLSAIRPSSQALIEQHLAAFQAARARNVLLITDLEYVEYTGREYLRQRLEPPPLQWTPNGWQADKGIRFTAFSALEGVTLDAATFARWMPSFELKWHECWLWHIAPNGTETTNFGRLHRVGAFAFTQLPEATVIKSLE